jgi:hypothetical protein
MVEKQAVHCCNIEAYADSCYVNGGYNLHTVFKAVSDKNSTFHSHSGDEIMMGLGL